MRCWLLAFIAAEVFSTYQTLAFGGEKAFFTTIPFEGDESNRQYVCDNYDAVRNGTVPLRFALAGMEIRALIAEGEFFNYDPVTGINTYDPGLMVSLLDEVASRAGFTWRESFGVQIDPAEANATWTEMLLWAVDTYDVAVSWWDQSVERMEAGVAFVEPWFDGSVVLIDKDDPPLDTSKVNLFNWLRPYESSVWLLTLFTIFISGTVYQILEYLNGERDAREFHQWFMDNLYLSCLNFTQNFEYAPNSLSGRVFGVSMSIWALVMTATYTANLASLFVEQLSVPVVVDSIDQAIEWGIPICTYANTNSDLLIEAKYPEAIRVPKATELEAYTELHSGKCGLVAGYKDNWLGFEQDVRYNPYCDLRWVGRTVEVIKSGFAVKADVGHMCTSLIRDVFNLHLTEIITDGFLLQLWEKHRAKNVDFMDCEEADKNELRRMRRLALTKQHKDTGHHVESRHQHSPHRQRKLASASKAGAKPDGSPESSLSLQQMCGTFAFHYAMMITAILLSSTSIWCKKRRKSTDLTVRETYRTHGPLIGQPPPINTYRSLERMRLSNVNRAVTNSTGSLESNDDSIKGEDCEAKLKCHSKIGSINLDTLSYHLSIATKLLEEMHDEPLCSDGAGEEETF